MTSTTKRRKVFTFEDSQSSSFSLKSTWGNLKSSRQTRSIQCQTTSELYNLQEMEVQSGRYTRITQDQISQKEAPTILSDFLIRKYPRISAETWVNKILDGHVTVDCEVETDPESKLDVDYFIEYVDSKSNMSCQTEPIPQLTMENSSSLQHFLNKVSPLIIEALEENDESNIITSRLDSGQSEHEEGKGKLWKVLEVDFEKKRVTFPDWTNAKHFPAIISRCSQTRNKERVYDLEYEDGSKNLCVREEHIRVINLFPDGQNKNRKIANDRRPLLQEGMRVHAKIMQKNGVVKYLPGRIVKISRNVYDVECEGSRLETGLTIEDLLVGLQEGQQVEARRPSVVHLQCTSLDWNCTGNIIVASFGKNDLNGWCDIAGAICCWNVFSKKTVDITDSGFFLDHSSSLMKVCCHPISPSLVAAGSFNGEVLVWDMTTNEPPIAISPITEFSHKEPVVDLKWVYNSTDSSDGWLLVSIGADGKVLFWSIGNKLKHPVKGFLMKKRKTTQKKAFLQCNGATSLAVSITRNLRFVRPKWIVIGQEGGSFVRCQAAQLFSHQMSNDTFMATTADEVFPILNGKEQSTFSHHPHVGAVTSMDWSPFNRNIFISGGSDGEIKLFHILEQQPIRRFRPNSKNETIGFITAVRFSPWRPMVFAVSTAEGVLYLYDLRKNPLHPTLRIDLSTDLVDNKDLSDKRSTTVKQHLPSANIVPIADIVFNHAQKDIIAVADWRGRVSTWKLPLSYAIYNNDELNAFQTLCNIDLADN